VKYERRDAVERCLESATECSHSGKVSLLYRGWVNGMVVVCLTWDQKVTSSPRPVPPESDAMHICKYLPSLSCLLCDPSIHR